MEQKNKVKLLKVLAFPASAAFMMGVGVTAIHADEVTSTDIPTDTAVESLPASDTVVTETSSSPVVDENATSKTEESTTPVVVEEKETAPATETEPVKEEVVPVEEDKTTTEETVTPVVEKKETTVQKAPAKVSANTPALTDNQEDGVAEVNGLKFKTLQEAIDSAPASSTVKLLKDVQESIFISKSITLDLNGKTITSKSQSRPITIDSKDAINVTIYNGKITGGNPEDASNALGRNGGGIDIYNTNENATITLSKLNITGNISSGSGGGISARGVGKVIISECVITKNTLVKYDPTSTNSGSGGGISISSSPGTVITVIIENSNISDNNAGEGNGGGITSNYCTLTIKDSTINGNKAQSTGGGITVSNGTNLELENTTISDNTAGSQGGGIYGVQATIKMNKCTISGNISNNAGGGLSLTSCTLNENSLKNSSIINNIASWGGGISVVNCNGVYIPTDLIVNNNTGKNYGADDIYSTGSTLTLYAPAKGKLDKCGHSINGWYWDDVLRNAAWKGHKDDEGDTLYAAKMQYGTYNSTLFLKAAHGVAKVTINYVYEDGSQAAETVTKDVEYGGEYSIDSPVIDGYQVDKAVVSGSILEKDYSTTVTYKKINKYVINYDANGGTGAPESETSETIDKEHTFDISSVVPTRDGYTFKGWNTEKDAKKAIDYKNISLNSDNPEITLYAVWEKNAEPKKPEDPKKPEEPKKDDTKKEENKEQPKSDVQPTSVTTNTTATQATESTGVQTGVDTNATYLTSLAGISLAGALLLKKKKDQE